MISKSVYIFVSLIFGLVSAICIQGALAANGEIQLICIFGAIFSFAFCIVTMNWSQYGK